MQLNGSYLRVAVRESKSVDDLEELVNRTLTGSLRHKIVVDIKFPQVEKNYSALIVYKES